MSDDDRTQQDDSTQQIGTAPIPEPAQGLATTERIATVQDDAPSTGSTRSIPKTPGAPTRALPTTTEDLMDTARVTTPVTTPTTGSAPGTSGAPHASTGSPTAPEPAIWTAATAELRGVRVGIVVWGLVIAAVGVGLLASASGLVFDVELALIGLVAAAGVALLVGSLVSGRRRRR